VETTRRSLQAKRLQALPVYLFEDLASKRLKKEAEGVEVIDLSIGDPDLGAPSTAIENLKRNLGQKHLHGYTPEAVNRVFRQAVSRWMRERFNVEIDPDSEVLPVIGTKEGLAHLTMATADPNDVVLVPDPAYPVYARSTILAGAKAVTMPLSPEEDYLPRLDDFRGVQPKLVFLNYPNNPTSATAEKAFYEEAVAFARSTGALLVNDAAYSEVCFDGYHSCSILEVAGAKEVAVEFHSFSKTFSMAGWRVGFVVGSRRAIDALAKLKCNLDSGVFAPILLAASSLLEQGWEEHARMIAEYGKRRRMLIEALAASNFEYHDSPATLYIWVRIPNGGSSVEFAEKLLDRAGLLVAPGCGFGEYGEGYFRLSVTCPTEKVEIACERLREVNGI